jgi:hypothetical protein
MTAADREVAVELPGRSSIVNLALIGKRRALERRGSALPISASRTRRARGRLAAARRRRRGARSGTRTAPDGQPEAIAGSTKVEPLPGGHLGDSEVVWLIANRLEQVAARTRERVSSLDPVSEDLLIGVAATLEKQLWMLRAQRADA